MVLNSKEPISILHSDFSFKWRLAFRMYHFGVLVLQKKQTEPASLSQAKRKNIPHDSSHPSFCRIGGISRQK
jgi:hypothetical protein